MPAIKSQHSRTFEQLMFAHQESLLASLAAGIPADYAAYRQIVGQLQGVTDALKISEQADYNLSGDEPDAGR